MTFASVAIPTNVIPAQAGIHPSRRFSSTFILGAKAYTAEACLGCRLRGNDDVNERATSLEGNA